MSRQHEIVIRLYNRLRIFVRPGSPFFLIAIVLFVLFEIAVVFGLPTPTQLASIVGGWLGQYGLWAVFASYFIEGLFVLNFYWPGSFILFVAATSTSSLGALAQLYGVANAAAALSLTVNFVLGRVGLHRLLLRLWSKSLFDQFGNLLSRRGQIAFALVGFHINWLAVLVTFAGAARKQRYLSVLIPAVASHAIWSALLIYVFSKAGSLLRTGSESNYLVIAALVAVGLIICVIEAVRSRR